MGLMADMADMAANANATAGLRQAGRELLATLLDIGRTRLQLAATELEEEQLRLAGLLAGAVLMLFLLGVGTLLAAGWLVLAVEPAQRLATLGALALLFLGAALVALLRLRQRLARKPPLLQATLAELDKDHQALLARRGA